MGNFFESKVLKFQSNRFYAAMAIVLIVCFSSCKTTYNPSNYFKTIQKDTTIAPFVTEDIVPKIRKGDLLYLKVTSLNPQEDALFNIAIRSENLTNGGESPAGFYVDKEGNIEMHRLGLIHVEGMTLKDLEGKLVKDLSPYLKDIIVNTKFLNHKLTVIGAVGSPQQITLDTREKISILDALAISGNISETGDKTNILIIRETETGKQMKRVNLEDHSIFSSPWFYLKQDDVLYVSTSVNEDNEKRQRRLQAFTTISVVASLVFLIYNNILRK
ncbi:MAG: polysaccharide biosynthesis/export family protein [Bacteroidota bacterium]